MPGQFGICGRSSGDEETVKVVRIGYQKYGSFNVVKARHTFELTSSLNEESRCWPKIFRYSSGLPPAR